MNNLKKDLNVMVISGKDKGKTGTVKAIFSSKRKVIVSGINMIKKHVKPKGDSQGGILEMEAPIDSSNVAVVSDVSQEKNK